MDNFLTAFFNIDSDQSEEITIAELEKYMRLNNLKDAFVKKWINIFDSNDDGVITLDEYCSVLGLVTNEARIMREQFNIEHSAIPKTLPDDVKIIQSSVTSEMEIEMVDIEINGWSKCQNAPQVSKFIKEELDKAYGPSWHCVTVLGQFWSYFSSAPATSFQYKRGKYIYLIWKTEI